MGRVWIKFEPDNQRGQFETGTRVLDAATGLGIPIDAPCGGQGKCGKCRCYLREGKATESGDQRMLLGDGAYEGGQRLACLTQVASDAVIEIAESARLAEQAILEDGSVDLAQTALDAQVEKTALELPAPSLEDQRADLDRVLEALASAGTAPDLDDASNLLPGLSAQFREKDFAVTAVVRSGRLIAVEAGDTTGAQYGVGVDIGTTTVVAYLADLCSGQRLGTASAVNPQVAYGDDVVSRIQHLQSSPEALGQLQRMIVGLVDELIEEAAAEAAVNPRQVYRIAVVGNATMTHLLWGADPSAIAQAPYTPAYHRSLYGSAARLGLRAAPAAEVRTLPNVAGWIGADTTGVILSTGMHRCGEAQLAIDIGTNGEIVVGSRARLIACSCAAGPAFEGAQIEQGMRAASGAIDRVAEADGDLAITTIGGAPARGICGSGLIDAAAVLRRLGVVNEAGVMLAADAAEHLPDAARRRIIESKGQPAFVLAQDAQTAIDGPVYLSQRDIRQIQLAKGAIAAGIRIALREIGMEPGELARVLLAGAFGSYVRPRNAADIGLFPRELSERTVSVGNAAGSGAFLGAVSESRRREADEIAEGVEYLELASRLDFNEAFAEAMMFPELD